MAATFYIYLTSVVVLSTPQSLEKFLEMYKTVIYTDLPLQVLLSWLSSSKYRAGTVGYVDYYH